MTNIVFPKRWPTKPPKDTRCDMSVGWSPDQYGQPIIHRCPKWAMETVWYPGHPATHEVWVCTEHAESLAESGKAFRNPRKFPPSATAPPPERAT